MRENTDQKNSEYGHFSRSAKHFMRIAEIFCFLNLLIAKAKFIFKLQNSFFFFTFCSKNYWKVINRIFCAISLSSCFFKIIYLYEKVRGDVFAFALHIMNKSTSIMFIWFTFSVFKFLRRKLAFYNLSRLDIISTCCFCFPSIFPSFL